MRPVNTPERPTGGVPTLLSACNQATMLLEAFSALGKVSTGIPTGACGDLIADTRDRNQLDLFDSLRVIVGNLGSLPATTAVEIERVGMLVDCLREEFGSSGFEELSTLEASYERYLRKPLHEQDRASQYGWFSRHLFHLFGLSDTQTNQ